MPGTNRNRQTVAVVGGGASGMMAALTAAQTGKYRVLLLERQQRIGRKLLATGNGRCNLSNIHASASSYFGTDRGFASAAIEQFPPQEVLRFFQDLGLLTVTEADGRVYPLSDSANSVLDVLRFALDRTGTEILCPFPVDHVVRQDRGFRLLSGDAELSADAVILACGGAAGSKLGGVSDGYRLGKALGHQRSALYPSLTRILTASDYPRALKGIRVEAELRLSGNGRLLAERRGEIQFTENGVSGPAGFDLSRAVSFGGEGQLLHLRLLPYEEERILSLLKHRREQYPALEASELFTGMLHNRLGRTVVRAAGIPAAVPLSDLTEAELRAAARRCADFSLPVRGVEGFETAQVTAGGLLTGSFHPDTLESRLVPGLYACGELLDVDGPCGGYNLQWAWASGHLAGRLGT